LNRLQAPRFTYRVAWPRIAADEADRVVAFWLAHGALPNEALARQRVTEVVMYACDDRGAIAAVCTAVAQTPPQLGQPVYFYRSFVAPLWRGTRVVFRLLKQALGVLEAHAGKHDWPCIGVLLELENERFGRKGRMPVWPGVDLVYIGKSPRGLECRVHWFRRARLKPPD
jgi:hypothetical protein